MRHWAIQVFVDAHPHWKSVQESLTVKRREGWEYITFQTLASEIGRVKVEGKNIIAESLWGYSKLGE